MKNDSAGVPSTEIRSSRWWLAASGCAILAILAFPATRQIACAEIAWSAIFVRSGLSVPASSAPRRVSRADYCTVQAARVLASPPQSDDGSTDRTPTTAETLSRFGAIGDGCTDTPVLNAILLNHLADNDIALERPEEQVYLTHPERPNASTPRTAPGVNAAATLRLWDAAAIRGETLAPENAYFPLMSAVSLLIQHRDREALAALHRAAAKPHFDDYTGEEADAKTRLMSASLLGMVPVAVRSLIYREAPYAQFGSLHRLARTVVALAVQRERGGDHAGGFALRRDIARLGATVRTEARSSYGVETGVTLTALAAARPDGFAIAGSRRKSESERSAETRANYIAYLNRYGHPEEVVWYLAECRNGDAVRTILHDADDIWFVDPRVLLVLSYLWSGCVALLLNAWTILLLGAVTHAVARRISREKTAGHSLATWLGTGTGASLLFGTGTLLAVLVSHFVGEKTGGFSSPPTFGIAWMLYFGIAIVVPTRRKNGGTIPLRERLECYYRTAPDRAGRLLLLWAVGTLILTGVEAHYTREMSERFQNEGRYAAARQKVPLPGRVPLSRPYRFSTGSPGMGI